MKKIILGLLAATTLTFALNASSAVRYADPQKYHTINSITVGSTGNMYIYVNTPPSLHNPANCPNRHYTVAGDSQAYDYFFTQLVLAWKEGYRVSFAVQTNRCLLSGVEVSRFNVIK